jgi:hypothetical protein
MMATRESENNLEDEELVEVVHAKVSQQLDYEKKEKQPTVATW